MRNRVTRGESSPHGFQLIYIMSATAAGDVIVNDNQGQTFASSQVSIPADTLAPGTVLRVAARGTHHTDTSATNMETELSFAGVTLTTGAVLQSGNINDQGWQVDADFVCTSPTTLEAQGIRRMNSGVRTGQLEDMERTSPATFNPGQVNALNLSQVWGTSATANSITLRQFFVTLWGPI